MNELHFAYRIRQQLNQGLHQLPPETIRRLDDARQIALSHQKQPHSVSVLAATAGFVQHSLENLGYKQIFASFALVLGLAFSTFWMADQHVSELEAIDSALLADDLPVRAFTDKGFDAWLKRTSPL